MSQPLPKTLWETVEAAATRFADSEAIVEFRLDDEEKRYKRVRSVRYGELVERANAMGLCWASRGLKPGDRVAVLLDNGADMVASEWSCLLSGCIWVALNARSSAQENAAILADASPSLVLVDPSRRKDLDEELLRGATVLETGPSLDAELTPLLGRERLASGACPPEPSRPLRIRYTSGTSGKPKGAVLSVDGYNASLETVASVLGPLDARSSVLQAAPMTHASGAMFAPHARVGARALAIDRFDAGAFVELVEAEHATAAFLVPTMLLRVLDGLEAAGRMPSLANIVYGGAAMPPDRLQRGLELLGPVFVGIYGLTESTWPVAALLHEDHPQGSAGPEAWLGRLASCGRPTAVGELRIVDDAGEDVADGELGEIWVRGRNTMLGYWDVERAKVGEGQSAEPKGLDAEGWMHTGDLAARDAEGFVTIVDRLHDMIVSGGFNVYPREVEEALSEHPAVLEAAVVGRRHPEWGEIVHASVVLRPGKLVSSEALALHCGARTADYKKPRSIAFVDELPRNASGKILRRRLREP